MNYLGYPYAYTSLTNCHIYKESHAIRFFFSLKRCNYKIGSCSNIEHGKNASLTQIDDYKHFIKYILLERE